MLFTHQRKPYHIIFISRRVTLHIVGLTPSPSNTRGRTRTDTVSILSRLSLPLDYTGRCRLWELNPPSPFYENGPFNQIGKPAR